MLHDDISAVLRPQIARHAALVQAPAGFDTAHGPKKAASEAPDPAQLDDLKVKKAWEIATAPAKQIPMSLLMSYMTGNSLQVIPIMMTLTLLWNPLKAIFTETGPAFRPLHTEANSTQILVMRLTFIVCQLAGAAIGVWKLGQMGLIPNREADWLAWKTVAVAAERVAVV